MAMLAEDLVKAELRRLRFLDREHRRISEEAESLSREVRDKARAISKQLRELLGQARQSPEKERAWTLCQQLVEQLAHL
jgi:hypothetical protein